MFAYILQRNTFDIPCVYMCIYTFLYFNVAFPMCWLFVRDDEIERATASILSAWYSIAFERARNNNWYIEKSFQALKKKKKEKWIHQFNFFLSFKQFIRVFYSNT